MAVNTIAPSLAQQPNFLAQALQGGWRTGAQGVYGQPSADPQYARSAYMGGGSSGSAAGMFALPAAAVALKGSETLGIPGLLPDGGFSKLLGGAGESLSSALGSLFGGGGQAATTGPGLFAGFGAAGGGASGAGMAGGIDAAVNSGIGGGGLGAAAGIAGALAPAIYGNFALGKKRAKRSTPEYQINRGLAFQNNVGDTAERVAAGTASPTLFGFFGTDVPDTTGGSWKAGEEGLRYIDSALAAGAGRKFDYGSYVYNDLETLNDRQLDKLRALRPLLQAETARRRGEWEAFSQGGI